MMLRQFSVFVGVGLASAFMDIVTTSALLWLHVHYAVSAAAGFAVGLVVNYMGHSRLSFPAAHSVRMAGRFGLVVALNLGLTLLLVEGAALWLNSPMAGKLVAIPIVAVHGFLWGKYWVFK